MEFNEKLQLVVDYVQGLLDSIEKGEEVSEEAQLKLDSHIELLKASDEPAEEAAPEAAEEAPAEEEAEKEETAKSAVHWENDMASASIDAANIW